MPTRNQIIVIQSGKKALDWSDPQYRMVLRNVGGVESCKDLDNDGVENVLAVMEDAGFDSHPEGPTYWRNRVGRRKLAASPRILHKIAALVPSQRYQLAALCERFSGGRVSTPEQLRPYEAHNLVEMLKAVIEREARDALAAAPVDR